MSEPPAAPLLPPDLGLAFRELAAARRARRWAWVAVGTQTLLLGGLGAAWGAAGSARSGIWMVRAPSPPAGGAVADGGAWRAVAAAVATAGWALDERGGDSLGPVADWLTPALAARLRARRQAAQAGGMPRPVTQVFVPVAVSEVALAEDGMRAAATVVGYLLVAVPEHGTEPARVERQPRAVELIGEAVPGLVPGLGWRVCDWSEVVR